MRHLLRARRDFYRQQGSLRQAVVTVLCCTGVGCLLLCRTDVGGHLELGESFEGCAAREVRGRPAAAGSTHARPGHHRAVCAFQHACFWVAKPHRSCVPATLLCFADWLVCDCRCWKRQVLQCTTLSLRQLRTACSLMGSTM